MRIIHANEIKMEIFETRPRGIISQMQLEPNRTSVKKCFPKNN